MLGRESTPKKRGGERKEGSKEGRREREGEQDRGLLQAWGR